MRYLLDRFLNGCILVGTGRPYFIDRGKTKNLTLATKGSRLLLPCVINNPNADVYLFHEENVCKNSL